MKKIIITSLLIISVTTFAKTEGPKSKVSLSKKEKRNLVATKTIQEAKIKKIIVMKENVDPCVVAVVVPVPANMDALGACLKRISESLNP